MTATQYKEKVGLNKSTALLNEKQRAKLIENGMERRVANLVPGSVHKKENKEKIYEKIGKTLADRTDETDNLYGTCPAQLLDRLVKAHDRLGRTPKRDEIGFHKTLVKVYGSMKRACEIAGIPYRKSGINLNHWKGKYTDEDLLGMLRTFNDKNGRNASWSDCRRKMLPAASIFHRRFGGLKQANQAAGL